MRCQFSFPAGFPNRMVGITHGSAARRSFSSEQLDFFLFAAFVCDSLKNQPAAMCICGAPFAFSYFINAAVLKKFEFFWFVRYGFFAEWMRGRRIGVTPGVWGVWYALLLGGLLLVAIHQRKERKEL